MIIPLLIVLLILLFIVVHCVLELEDGNPDNQ